MPYFCNQIQTFDKMTSKTFNRYIWLLNLLLQQRRFTFQEISYRWKNSYLGDGKPLALRTFHVHREAIAELFGIEIKCDTSTYEYFVSSPEELRKDKTKQWLFDSFSISNMIEAGRNMKDRILFEEIPAGTEFLQTIIEAMQRGKELTIDYHPFQSQRATYHLQPYAMKVYNHRWYVVGHLTEPGGIRNIALDRILKMDISDESFSIPKWFDAEEYYAHTVGIFVNEKLKPQTVVIRAYGVQAEYIRTLPLHSSQNEIETTNKEYCDFRYYLCLTPELTSQLLAMGEKVEILEPQELRQKIKQRLLATISRYQ